MLTAKTLPGQVLTTTHLRYMRSSLKPTHVNIALDLAAMEGVGVASFKMDNSLTNPIGVGYCLNSCNLRNSLRSHALQSACKLFGRGNSYPLINEMILEVRRILSLVRYPIIHFGLETVSDRPSEMKIYVQGNLAEEEVTPEKIFHRRPTQAEELNTVTSLCRVLNAREFLPVSETTLAIANSCGLALDMVGVDLSASGNVELKTYISTANERTGLYGIEGLTVAHKFIDELSKEFDLGQGRDIAKAFCERMLVKRGYLALNQLVTEVSGERDVRLKMHFDNWELGADRDTYGLRVNLEQQNYLDIANDCAELSMLGAHIPDIMRLTGNLKTNGLAMDSVSVDYDRAGACMKFYVTPDTNFDGDGVSYEGGAVDNTF